MENIRLACCWHGWMVDPWVRQQAGVLHTISPISMKLGQFKGSTPKLKKTSGGGKRRPKIRQRSHAYPNLGLKLFKGWIAIHRINHFPTDIKYQLEYKEKQLLYSLWIEINPVGNAITTLITERVPFNSLTLWKQRN